MGRPPLFKAVGSLCLAVSVVSATTVTAATLLHSSLEYNRSREEEEEAALLRLLPPSLRRWPAEGAHERITAAPPVPLPQLHQQLPHHQREELERQWERRLVGGAGAATDVLGDGPVKRPPSKYANEDQDEDVDLPHPHHHQNHQHQHRVSPRPTLAFDVGFFNGDDTRLLLSQGYSVVAVEANPVLAQRGREMFSQEISEGSLALVNAALPVVNTHDARKEGEEAAAEGASIMMNINQQFYVNRWNMEWSSFIFETGCRGQEQNGSFGAASSVNCNATAVRTTSCARLLKKYGVPHILKLDVEGGEWSCLRALKNFPSRRRPSYVVAENNPLLFDFDLLVSLGYDRFKYVNQGFFEESDWGSTSGPLGEYGLDCKARWRWGDRATIERTRAESAGGKHKLCNVWADIHARHNGSIFSRQSSPVKRPPSKYANHPVPNG
jgi:FkbM family methyltransferase